MNHLADIHCHIIPYVDDGATTKDVSRELVRMQYEQGVRTICATPHLRRGMFETPQDQIFEQFDKLKERTAAEFGSEIQLYLSREYHADRLLLAALEKEQIIPFGIGKTLLLEFSNRHSLEEIHWFIKIIQEAGFKPLIAHAERYMILWKSPDLVEELIDLGAMIQMNVSSILGREGRKQAGYCKKLLKRSLIHVVASDAHDPDDRPPELDTCFSYLKRKYGEEYATQLMSTNPLGILSGKVLI